MKENIYGMPYIYVYCRGNRRQKDLQIISERALRFNWFGLVKSIAEIGRTSVMVQPTECLLVWNNVWFYFYLSLHFYIFEGWILNKILKSGAADGAIGFTNWIVSDWQLPYWFCLATIAFCLPINITLRNHLVCFLFFFLDHQFLNYYFFVFFPFLFFLFICDEWIGISYVSIYHIVVLFAWLFGAVVSNGATNMAINWIKQHEFGRGELFVVDNIWICEKEKRKKMSLGPQE